MLHKPILTQSKAWLLYVCLLTMLAGCSQCNKVVEPNDPTNPTGLPPATQVGAGTFGCMVNGKAWMPSGRQSFLGPSNPSINYNPFFGDIGIGADIYLDKPVNGSRLKEYISFSAQDTVFDVGTYNLTNSNIVFVFSSIDEEAYYSDTEIASNCQMVITKLDKTNKVIAGTFSFTLERKSTGKKVTVTDGRFDLKYL